MKCDLISNLVVYLIKTLKITLSTICIYTLFPTFYVWMHKSYCILWESIFMIFAPSKSWEIQSKALERSIRTVPTKFLMSRDFSQCSKVLIRHDLNYKIFYKLIWNLIILFRQRKKGYCEYIFHKFWTFHLE